MIKGILFDKDGTLIEIEGPWISRLSLLINTLSEGCADTHTRLSSAIGLDPINKRAVPFSVLAQGTFFDVANILVQNLQGIDQKTILRHLMDIEHQAPRHITALPKVRPTLAKLHKQGYVMGIISNDCIAGIHATITALEINAYISFSAGNDSGYGHKPSADFITAFCDFHNLEPNEVVIVGDSPADMETAILGHCPNKIAIHHDSLNTTLSFYTPYIIPDLGRLPEVIAKIDLSFSERNSK